jgi:hypothetical protein
MAKKQEKEPWVQPPPRMIRTYFIRGTPPKGSGPYALEDPPTTGWGHVVLVPGEKRSTILCPFQLLSWQVPNGCMELTNSKNVEATPARIADEVTRAWKAIAAMGMQRDYAVAALVLTLLGAEVPKVEVAVIEGKEDAGPKVQGGKPIVQEALRVVNPESKRGEVAKFFHTEQPQSLHEAMARLGLTRSGVLSHLHCLNRDHGIGYVLANDCATLLVPEGFGLFDYVAPEKKAPVIKLGEDGQPREVKKRTSGKPVNPEALSPIPTPGKRAAVAELFIKGFYGLEVAQRKLELNRSAVLSHLFTINKENGLGYELSEDGSQARLIVPEGHTVFCAKQARTAKKEVA